MGNRAPVAPSSSSVVVWTGPACRTRRRRGGMFPHRRPLGVVV